MTRFIAGCFFHAAMFCLLFVGLIGGPEYFNRRMGEVFPPLKG